MVPVRVVGRDIGQGLVTLVNSRRAKSIEDLEEKIERWRDREVAKWLSKDMEDKAEAANDRAETIKVIIDHVDDHERLSPPTVSDVTDAINRLFDDTPGGGKVTLSTIHKAKGLEWDRVYLLDAHLVPSRWARRPEEIEQELNLLYVAITRAKLNLVYINSGLSFVE
jgi:DNA helicase-2/ATP-dependent DNA helicase PcrA